MDNKGMDGAPGQDYVSASKAHESSVPSVPPPQYQANPNGVYPGGPAGVPNYGSPASAYNPGSPTGVPNYGTPAGAYNPGGGNPPGVYRVEGMMYQQNPPMQPTIVITSSPCIDDDCPVGMMCPYCRQQIVTRVTKTPGGIAWVIFAVCFALGFFFLIPWCLCWIPLVVSSFQSIEHTCPNCNRCVGKISR